MDPDNPQFNNIIGARWVEVGQINVITRRYDWVIFLQSLVGNVIGKRMEAVVDDDMEVEQEIVVIPVKDAELFEAYSTSHGVTTIHLNNNSKPSEAVVCKICSLKVTSMAALERHQKAKY